MQNNLFIQDYKLGKIFYNKILFESYYPILFTCVDKNNTLYLVACHYNSGDTQKWILTKTDDKTVVDMLSDKITMREAFLKYNDIQISILCKNEQYSFKYNDIIDWDKENSLVLPDKGEFINADEGEFDEEIFYFSNNIRNIEIALQQAKLYPSKDIICNNSNISKQNDKFKLNFVYGNKSNYNSDYETDTLLYTVNEECFNEQDIKIDIVA